MCLFSFDKSLRPLTCLNPSVQNNLYLLLNTISLVNVKTNICRKIEWCEMFRPDDEWDDVRCETERAFVCQKKIWEEIQRTIFMLFIFVRSWFDLNQEIFLFIKQELLAEKFEKCLFWFTNKYHDRTSGSRQEVAWLHALARPCLNWQGSPGCLWLSLIITLQWFIQKELFPIIMLKKFHLTMRPPQLIWSGRWKYEWKNLKSDSDFDWFELPAILMQNCLVVAIFSEVETALNPAFNPS